MKSSFRVSMSKASASDKASISKALAEHKVTIGSWCYASTDKSMPDIQAIVGHLSSKYKNITFCIDLMVGEAFGRSFYKDSEKIPEDLIGILFPSSPSFSAAVKKKEKIIHKRMIQKKENQIKEFKSRAEELRLQLIEMKKSYNET